MPDKSDKIIELLKDTADLACYAWKKNWLGFGECPANHLSDYSDTWLRQLRNQIRHILRMWTLPIYNRDDAVHRIITSMLEILHPIEQHKITLIESLHIVKEEIKEQKYDSFPPLVEPLVHFIDRASIPENLEEIDKFWEQINHQLKTTPHVNEQLFEQISWTMMNSNLPIGIGFVFFYLETDGLFIYPHDDGGYGFILAENAEYPEALMQEFRNKGLIQVEAQRVSINAKDAWFTTPDTLRKHICNYDTLLDMRNDFLDLPKQRNRQEAFSL